jgi:protein phosphatase
VFDRQPDLVGAGLSAVLGGGQQAGEQASRQAVQAVLQYLRDAGSPAAPDRADQVRLAIEHANTAVNGAANTPETRGMATTLVVVFVEGPTVTVGNVGDSRCYIVRGDTMTQVTRDHSFVAEEVARGALTPEEAATHPRRNMLTRAIGVDGRVQVDTFQLAAEENDVFILCSDGLHGMVSDGEIETILRTEEPGEAAEALVALANEAGGKDNVTVVVARVVSLEPPPLTAPEESSARTVTGRGARRRNPLAAAFRLLFRRGR